MQTVMSNFIKLLFCLWQGACRDSFICDIKTMRIGIITLPLHTNYGGILQAYALQTVLERMGHEVEILEEPHEYKRASLKRYIRRVLKKCIGKRSVINYEGFMRKWQPKVAIDIDEFINTYIHRRIVKYNTLRDGEYDAFIVGSDQVWRPSYNQHLEKAFLDFTEEWKDVKRIAYAASFGTDEWEFTNGQTELCKKLVQKFDFVSVREDSAVALCKEKFGIEAKHVLDPTMLLTDTDYYKIIGDIKISDSPYIFSYLLDENKDKLSILDTVSKKLGLPVRKIKLDKDISKIPMSKLKSLIYPSVQKWLASFAQADFVVTDSFHGTVFSIIFNKPFVVLPNKGRGVARFESLLKAVGLENRIFSEYLIGDNLYEDFPCQINNILLEKSERIKLKIDSLLC